MHKNNKSKNWLLKICTILFLLILAGCQATKIITPPETPNINISIPKEETSISPAQKEQPPNRTDTTKVKVKKGQNYSTKDEVAAYIHEFKILPANFITKAEAQKLGWDNSKGNLWEVTKQKSIGGDSFGNMEGLLPKANGRKYYECDINYKGGYRGAERIVYSNDGLIFYTNDHYKTFKKLY
jgi:guanyl-specific ribonuclease Sa